MKSLTYFVLFLILLQSSSLPQTKLDGTYNLKMSENQDYFEEYVFTSKGLFNYTRLLHLGNELGHGEYSIEDSVLTLKFFETPAVIRDSLRSYYVVDSSKASRRDSTEYFITVLNHEGLPLINSSAQLIDEKGFSIIDKVKKYWDVDSEGKAKVIFENGLKLYGIKVANSGFETVTIPVKENTRQVITVNLLEQDKCFYSIEPGTVRTFYIKYMRFSGFYIRAEDSPELLYYKKKKE
jgi:hypothetical protein